MVHCHRRFAECNINIDPSLKTAAQLQRPTLNVVPPLRSGVATEVSVQMPGKLYRIHLTAVAMQRHISH